MVLRRDQVILGRGSEGSSGAFLTFAGTTVALMEFTVQGVDQVDSDYIRFAIFDSHSQDRTGAIAEDGSSVMLLVWSK